MGKGVGFGRKVAERIEVRPEDRLYSLQKYKERGGAKEIIKSIAPEFLELTNAVLDEAEKVFGKIDRMVLFPLADHIAFAVKRIQNHEQISNPLTEDIRVLFHMEFKVAESIRPLLKKQFQIDIEDDEIGYVALHIHSAIEDEKVSQAMICQGMHQYGRRSDRKTNRYCIIILQPSDESYPLYGGKSLER